MVGFFDNGNETLASIISKEVIDYLMVGLILTSQESLFLMELI